ncbi:hypothetical protein [Roseateles sp. BYS96W]|uniref:Uncharacterized protein n=1 Tax=Pelomonas nitida TaxID=3299027 RepID=A0ABW7G1R3_9BURK
MFGVAETEPSRLAETATAITHLDELLSALMRGMAPGRPWQRQLSMRLAQAGREIQVMRMTIAMDREPKELVQAALNLHATLCAVGGELASARADPTTTGPGLGRPGGDALMVEHKKIYTRQCHPIKRWGGLCRVFIAWATGLFSDQNPMSAVM